DGDGLARARRRAAAMDRLRALVVVHQGELVLAEAFRGPALAEPVNVKSVSKTIVATLTGIALDQGVLADVDQPVAPLLGELVPANVDARVADITIAHLLTMQAGLERTSGANYGGWVQSPNWVADALARPFVAEPGARMLYSTGSYHLLAVALARAAGRDLLDLARAWLGAPMDITVPPWTRDPQGYYLGGNNMALSPLALARFAETWRRRGRYAGARVVSADWVEAAWTPRTRSPWSGDRYGYGWFLTRLAGAEVAYARGYGGQMVYVVPRHELSVVVTSSPSRPARSRGYVGALHDLVADHLIPAA
ncbi:MAG: serine hydrolase domain-containing protein, partial [Alphaproteobacteria bacterium]